MTTSAPTQTTTMRALATTNFGPAATAFEAVTVPLPEPLPTEIQVQVHAASINPVDWKSRGGSGFGLWGTPPIIGWDVSGVVTAVGGGSSLYRVGDEVFGMPHFPRQAGAYAEYVVAPSRQFAPKPAGLSHVEAAALPLVGLTAWQGLVEVARLGAGERVLIHAAGGGVGHVAVQIAKARGAHVIATASAGKHAWLRSLGADELVDYRAVRFEEVVSGIDVVLDAYGGDYTERSIATVRDGGRIVTLPGGLDLSAAASAELQARGISAGWTLVEPDRHGLLALAALVDAGQLRPQIAATFPLDEVAKAHELGEAGGTAGKIVLEVR